MDFKRLTNKAKDLVDKRGGTESLKGDAAELREIAGRKGSLSDKAKAAGQAIKEPGAGTDSAAAGATEAERERASSKTEGEQRGKHSDGNDDQLKPSP